MYASKKLVERMKHPKLVGADVFVARLANSNNKSVGASRKPGNKPSKTPPASDSPPTGSLHDELICKVANARVLVPVRDEDVPVRSAVDSRPCYRCVCYMHSV